MRQRQFWLFPSLRQYRRIRILCLSVRLFGGKRQQNVHRCGRMYRRRVAKFRLFSSMRQSRRSRRVQMSGRIQATSRPENMQRYIKKNSINGHSRGKKKLPHFFCYVRYRRVRQTKWILLPSVHQSQGRNEMRLPRRVPAERNGRQDLQRHRRMSGG